MRKYAVILCSLGMPFFAGCSYYWSEGGEMNKKQKEHLESLLGEPEDIDFSEEMDMDEGAGEYVEVTPPNISDPEEPGDGGEVSTGDPLQDAINAMTYSPSDEQICNVLKASELIKKSAADAIAYLCERDGLRTLRSKNYKDAVGGTPHVEIVTNKNEKGVSYFTTMNSTYDDGTISGMVRLSDKYCTSFDAYKKVYGAKGLADIESLLINRENTPSNGLPAYKFPKGTGCNYKFTAKTQYLVVKPIYIGQLRTYSNPEGTAFFETSKLTKAVQQVNDIMMFTIGVTDQNGFLQTYNYKSTNAPNFNGTLHSNLLQKGKETVIEGTKYKVAAVKKLSN